MILHPKQILNALTIDVEDYYHVSAFESVAPRSAWNSFESRVSASTRRILDLFDEYDAKGTFFVLGWVAERFPELVADITARGHEIGCHTYWHRLIYQMTPQEFREDLRRATQVLEDITGEKILSFRAPSFSIVKDSLWALDVLIEQGYRYDSSIYPVYHDNYGIPDANRFPHLIQREAGEIHEFPLSIHPLGKYNLPVAGGGYFRLYPERLSMRWLRSVNEKQQQPFVFYLHPWEIDVDQPRIAAPLKSRFRHYQNLASTERKLRRLLASFQFQTLQVALANAGGEMAVSR